MKVKEIVNKEGKLIKILTEISNEDIKYGIVTIPNDVDIIGNKAFYKMPNITKVVMGDNVVEIEADAFSFCENLEEVILSKKLETINEGAFCNCISLNKIDIPDSVTKLHTGVFSGCSSIKNITLPSKITEIPDELFYGCKSLTDFEIPKSVKSIGYDAFEDCKELRKISIPKEVVEIKNIIFYGCNNLKEIKVEEGNTCFKSIAGVLFSIDGKQLICYPTGRNCVRYEIPKTVEEIGDYAFEGVSRLKEIKINDGVKKIGDGAFKGCKSLSKIAVPSSVESLGEEAFSECENLEKVNLFEGVKSIEWNTFYKCSKLKEVKIPEGVTSIGDNVFLACSGLQKVVLPSSILHIEYNAFNTNKYLGGKSTFAYYKNGILYYDDLKGKKDLKFPVNLLYAFSNIKEFDKFMKESDFRAFNSNFQNIEEPFEKREDIDTVSFFKFAKALGCFSKKKIIDKDGEETNVTIGQKASSVLARLLKTPPFDSNVYGRLFEHLTVFSEPNQDFLDFISIKEEKGYGNLRTLFLLEKDYPGIFAKAVSDFDKVKNFRSTIGKDGKSEVVPWDKALIMYYNKSNYTVINKNDEDIAEVFSEKGLEQSIFDKAVKLRQSAMEENVPEHILGEPLFEEKVVAQKSAIEQEESIKDSIKRIKMKTAQSLKQSTDLLEKMYDKKFFYEWLNKRDAHNPIIGLYCDCCATIGNTDYGRDISRATVIAPDVQNIVVRNLKDEIIAKAAVYVNSDLGYAVVNNFEINSGYRQTQIKDPFGGRYTGDKKKREEKTQKERREDENREQIFEAFMRGITDFVKRYNELHPNKPIKQVNAGTGYTKLKKQVEQFERATQKLSVPANYSFYDALRHDQYILYKEDTNKIEEEKER